MILIVWVINNNYISNCDVMKYIERFQVYFDFSFYSRRLY